MTAHRFQCPAAAYVRLDRHMVTDRRWTLTDPAGVETVVCSLACVITVACRWLPVDLKAAQSSERSVGEAAA